MSAPRLVTVTTGAATRPLAVRELIGRVGALGWLDEAGGRVVVQVGVEGRSARAVETAAAVAAALRERSPLRAVDVLDPAASGPPRSGLARASGDADDAVEVQGPAGTGIRVPRAWFDGFFLVTVTAVRPDGRWRMGGALQVQAETLARLNPGLPAAVLLAEAHRLGGADLAIACGAHPTAGDWWAASPNEVQLDGALARAAGLAPDDLPAIRVIARHESLEPWDTSVALPDLVDVPASAARAALGATRERASAATRRAVEDVGRISRTLRKVPQALRRKLASRTRRKSA